ncbi:hypothetical protein GOB13_08405 [Sinorhizobium meliloti]|nr:hypothetical protein [Sinorhizobium meliloti]MDX0063682.1 hypothetical protein [Sinorhizobium meliloti]MDX0081355.1 hypothetical protein [Sinorhizobium meliloti]MDX0355932.1 hypothetical protein [Sinorhizobium meliloti]
MQALDHVHVLRPGRPKNMNMIDSRKLRRRMRAENCTDFSSSRSIGRDARRIRTISCGALRYLPCGPHQQAATKRSTSSARVAKLVTRR